MIIETTYVSYLAISTALTVWVARTLSKNGRVFLVTDEQGHVVLNFPFRDAILD